MDTLMIRWLDRLYLLLLVGGPVLLLIAMLTGCQPGGGSSGY